MNPNLYKSIIPAQKYLKLSSVNGTEFCPSSSTNVSNRKCLLWRSLFHYSLSFHKYSSCVCVHSLFTLFCVPFITYSGQLVIGLANGHLFMIFIFDALKRKPLLRLCQLRANATTTLISVKVEGCLYWLPWTTHIFTSINANSSTYRGYVHCPHCVSLWVHSGSVTFIFMPACPKI